MRHFPDKMCKGRVPDRTYFYNVLNSYQSNYLQQLIKHAQEQRNAGTGEARQHETIDISDKWWDALTSVPFISRKCAMVAIASNLVSALYRKKGTDAAPPQGELEARAASQRKAQGRPSGHIRPVQAAARGTQAGGVDAGEHQAAVASPAPRAEHEPAQHHRQRHILVATTWTMG